MPRAKPITSRRRKTGHYRACSGPDRLSYCDSVRDRAEPRLATPFHGIRSLVARAPCYGLRRTSIPAFLPRISRSWHSCAGKRAHYYNRANRSLPVQSQPHLFVFHPAPTWIVSLVERPLAAGNSSCSCWLRCCGCDPTRRTVSRAQLPRPVFELQGRCPPLALKSALTASCQSRTERTVVVTAFDLYEDRMPDWKSWRTTDTKLRTARSQAENCEVPGRPSNEPQKFLF